MKIEKALGSLNSLPFHLQPRRARYVNISDVLKQTHFTLDEQQQTSFEAIDLVYRTLCGVLYNFVPTSGHPGGSISSGRIVEALLYSTMEYDFLNPNAEEADLLVYAAGHKAMGLYAMWALRNELVRIHRRELLPETNLQLRLEDLLGFRRNPTNETPLYHEHHARPLDGHPTPATPFVRIATGASGVGVPAALGLAFAALDTYGEAAPKVHILEGEGGMTPGRVHEALAAAASANLKNAIMHVDWNQASIDSDHVCRDGDIPGDYVQWTPAELCMCHDWNVIEVPDGTDFHQILAAQQAALALQGTQPTAIVYRTTKGWKYGIEGKSSHGAGHKFCSDGYYESCKEFENYFDVTMPRFSGEKTLERIEKTFFDTLMIIRQALTEHRDIAEFAGGRILEAKRNLKQRARHPRVHVPQLSRLYQPDITPKETETPEELHLKPGESVTLRATLGNVLNYLNKKTRGAFIGSAADLLNSTSVANLNNGFGEGFFRADNPDTRLIAVGGICEDAMGAFMAGVSSFGRHIGVTSSYGAFIGALEHVAARLHGIGQQAKGQLHREPYNTWIMVNAHAGAKTGEDGPTHADPQVLQLLQENFPHGVLVTLTPWDPQEIWPLVIAGLKTRPAVLAPFVTRPADKIVDREAMGLPPTHAAIHGVYAMRKADSTAKQQNGTVVLQGNGVAAIFVQEVLPILDEKGLNMNVYYVTSSELFNMLSRGDQEAIFPEAQMYQSMGITDFTLPTMYRWVRSNEGIRRTLHSFRGHHYLGSGQAHKVLQEAGIHAEGQLNAILDYAHAMERRPRFDGQPTGFGAEDKEHLFENIQTTMLTCVACGGTFDPIEYYKDEPLPTDEICLECERRSPEACAYCRAFWSGSNLSIGFHCKGCSQ